VIAFRGSAFTFALLRREKEKRKGEGRRRKTRALILERGTRLLCIHAHDEGGRGKKIRPRETVYSGGGAAESAGFLKGIREKENRGRGQPLIASYFRGSRFPITEGGGGRRGGKEKGSSQIVLVVHYDL